MDDPTPGTRRARWIVGLMLLTFLAGCSQTRLAYRYADWGVVWWVEDYISLTGEQEAQLSQDLEALRQWHCSAELPRYQQWLAVLTYRRQSGCGHYLCPLLDRYQERLFARAPLCPAGP